MVVQGNGCSVLKLSEKMKNYELLEQLLISSTQGPTFSKQIVKAIGEDYPFTAELDDTLSMSPVDEIIVYAFIDSENSAEFKAVLGDAIDRLRRVLIVMQTID